MIEQVPAYGHSEKNRQRRHRQEEQLLRSRSRLAGHVFSAVDRRSPVSGATLMLNFREVSCQPDGLFEAPLDALPIRVNLLVTAHGHHAHREVLDWAQVATGGLILRDFYLTPVGSTAARPRKPAPENGFGRLVSVVHHGSEAGEASHAYLLEDQGGSRGLTEFSSKGVEVGMEDDLDQTEMHALDWQDVDDEFSKIAEEVENSLDPTAWQATPTGWARRR